MGGLVPQVRFSGFLKPWKIKKAAEIFISVTDKNHSDLPVLSASQEKGMVLRDEIGIDIKYDESALNTYKRIQQGQFAIHLRSFQGGLA
jgi:type I restriction enzyme S subunit